nr:hypothetical protein [Micromonospora provocatoris]
MTRIALLSTSDTDLLSARASNADWSSGQPCPGSPASAATPLTSEADLVVLRVLGSPEDVRRPRRADPPAPAVPWSCSVGNGRRTPR